MPARAEPGEAILALNAGSSSIKFALFSHGGREPERLARGEIEIRKDGPAHFEMTGARGETVVDDAWPEASDEGQDGRLGRLLEVSERHLGARRLVAAGHRIVHGGARFTGPTRLTPDVLAAIEALTPLAPLHQPLGLAPIKSVARLRPNLAQFASFDTAFHHRLKPPVSRYALPLEFEERGIRRYGFHGLSYAYIARRLAEISPRLAARRTVVAHLGNGASLCAIRDGMSLDTTMGFSALDGLVMGTRPGAIDPGILLYLMTEEGLTADALSDLLYHRSGLLGVSGISGDMRTLIASDNKHAKAAVELFVFRIARETAAMANTLGGLDLLVFTGGIGEHAAPIRAMVADHLRWLGLRIDADANATGAERIDVPQSRVEVRVIPTDEELIIAREIEGLLRDASH